MANIFKLAENLLNNLDQSAQTSIQTALNKTPNSQNKTTKKQKQTTNLNPEYSSTSAPATSSISASSSYANLKQNISSSSLMNLSTDTYKNSSKSNKSKDEELIEFLNNPSPLDGNSSKSSSKSNLDKIDNTDEKVEFTIGNKSNKHSDTEDDKKNSESQAYKTKDDSKDPSNLGVVNSNDENRILKTEIVSLNEEIKSLLKRIKQTEDDYNRSRRKIENYQNQISESDKIIRELRSREEDMSENIRNKDSQIAILRIRFEESDSELKAKKLEIEAIRQESERILKDHTNSSDIQSQAFETLKEKLNELEINLQREKNAFLEAQKDHLQIQNKLENEKHAINETLHTIEKKLNEEKTKNSEINAQLKISKSSFNHLKQELEEYKLKATRTLQTKDRLIATLKENSASQSHDKSGTEFSDTNFSNLKLIEIDELKSERDHLKEELNSKIASIEMLRSEMMELESQTTIEIETLKDQVTNLTDQLDEQRQSKEYIEQDLKNIRQQLDFTHEELYKQKSILNNKIQERETEIERLRNQLTTKSLGTTTEKELENRLHLLTENLIQKQTMIEALQSEKHSIFLQLERSEKRLQDYENIVSSKKNVTIRMPEEEEKFSEANKIPYLRESPFDHEVTKKVKRAATEIDKFSIRLGVFLKRYPIARIFVIFYMILLHLWVLIVLFTYKPEEHDANYHAIAHPLHPK